MRKALALLTVLVLASPIFADGIDDAEAKRRGVPVEVVQLEHAKDRIATLEKQVAELQAKIVDLQKGPATKPAVAATTTSKPAVSPEIAAAIKAHKLAKGMTMADAEKSLGIKFTATRSGSEGSTYGGATFSQTPIGSARGMMTGGEISGIEYTVEVDTNGHITSWDSRPYTESSGTAGVRN